MPKSGSPQRRGLWPFLTTLGLPATMVALFKDDLAFLPLWQKASLGAVWILLLLATALWTEAWNHLRKKWGKDLAQWIDETVRNLFSRYRRRYLEHVYYQNRDFDVKGLSTHGPYNLELEDVFVDLTIAARPVHATTTDPIRAVPPELAGRRQIWDFLNSEVLGKEPLVLIGPPGSGKTTLLKEIALQLTRRHRKRPRVKGRLPVLLFLREHGNAVLEDESYTLPKAVEKALERRHGPTPPSGWVKRQLDAGRCLVLLDGLDEVARAETRQKVVSWVEAQMKAYGRNQFFVSSRPHGYRGNPIAGVTVLEVQSFSLKQVRLFVSNWYRANEVRASGKMDPGVEMNAREGAEDLIRRLWTSQTLLDFAVNPLLLTMIATVHRFRSRLPGRRVELYAEICEVFLGKRQASKGVEDELAPAQKQRVLQPLAFHLMCQEKREIQLGEAAEVIQEPLRRVAGTEADTATFLKEVEGGSGLLLELEAGDYAFAHLAFQEYLAAVHAREENKEEELVREIKNSWWHETLRLYGAQGDASSLLEACLSETPTVAALNLAIDFLEEAREVDPEWRERVDDFIAKGVESQDSERSRLAAGTLLERRVRDMVAVDKKIFVDPTYVTHAEYQLFMDEGGSDYRPDHWIQERFPTGQGLTAVVGVWPSAVEGFCRFLSQRYSRHHFRPPNLGELARYGLQQGPDDLTTAFGHWVRGEDAFVFERSRQDLPDCAGFLFSEVERDFLEYSRRLKKYIKVDAVDLDSDPLFDQASVFVRVVSHALALTRTLDFTRARRALDSARACALARDSTVDRDRDRARAFDRERAHVLDRVHALDRAHALALSLARAPNRALARELYFALDGARALDVVLARALASARDLVRDLDVTLARDLDVTLALAVARARDLDVALAFALSLARALDLDLARVLLRTAVELQSDKRFKKLSKELRSVEEVLFAKYQSLVILDARRRGELQAFEGLRIVMELREDE